LAWVRGSPQVLRGIGAPRPPLLGPRQQLDRGGPTSLSVSQRPHQSDIRGGESVRFAQLTQRDVLRCPFAHPWYRADVLYGLGEATAYPK
jgi:hypothetical protein